MPLERLGGSMNIPESMKKAVESLYDFKCTVVEYAEMIDQNTGLSSFDEAEVYTDLPCRLSYKNTNPTSSTDTISSLNQTIKLILSPNIIIKPGSKIIVSRNGISKEYKNSGEPALYSSHQEIELILAVEES